MDLTAQELSPSAFGNLAHEVLQRFGNSPVRGSADVDEIGEFLNETLACLVVEQFGTQTLPMVDVQVAQLRDRLQAFAASQAELTLEGWRIEHVETPAGLTPVTFPVGDGRTIQLSGRIDRIDYHPEQERWRIIDYKTGEKAQTPEAKHRKKDLSWIDLQLPLYLELARPLGVQGQVELAYFNLPKGLDEVGIVTAPWSDVELQQAREVARSVCRKILDGLFWDAGQSLSEVELYEFSRICQEGAFDCDDSVFATPDFFDVTEDDESW